MKKKLKKKNNKILAYIPARSGSKGIKNKNILLYKNKPLLLHTLKFANNLKNVYPFVSTDSIHYLKIVKKFQKNHCHYIRPKKYAQDNSLIQSGLKHALKWLKSKKKIEFDNIILLQPTSPNRTTTFFNQLIKKYIKNKNNSLMTIKLSSEHPEIMIKMKRNKNWNFLTKHNFQKEGRQYYKKFYIIDGSFYIFSSKFFYKYNNFFKENKTCIEFNNQKNNIDIDYKKDLEFKR